MCSEEILIKKSQPWSGGAAAVGAILAPGNCDSNGGSFVAPAGGIAAAAGVTAAVVKGYCCSLLWESYWQQWGSLRPQAIEAAGVAVAAVGGHSGRSGIHRGRSLGERGSLCQQPGGASCFGIPAATIMAHQYSASGNKVYSINQKVPPDSQK